MSSRPTLNSVTLARLTKDTPHWLVPCEGCRHISYVHVEQADGTRSCWTGGASGWCDCPEYVDPPHLQHAHTP